MVIVRTTKGVNDNKTGALTLTIPNVQLAQDNLMVWGGGWDTGNGDPVITWGADTFEEERTIAGGGIAARLAHLVNRGATDTRDVVATWTTTAPTAKAAFVTRFSEVDTLDQFRRETAAASGAPTTGQGGESQADEEAFVAVMVSEGPQSDAAGTPQNGWSAGQRTGTGGAPPVSNITVQEIFKIVGDPEQPEAELTGATVRDWACIYATFQLPVSQKTRDAKYMRELFRDWKDIIPLVEAHGFTVTLTDVTDPTVQITNFTDLRLEKVPV